MRFNNLIIVIPRKTKMALTPWLIKCIILLMQYFLLEIVEYNTFVILVSKSE